MRRGPLGIVWSALVALAWHAKPYPPAPEQFAIPIGELVRRQFRQFDPHSVSPYLPLRYAANSALRIAAMIDARLASLICCCVRFIVFPLSICKPFGDALHVQVKRIVLNHPVDVVFNGGP